MKTIFTYLRPKLGQISIQLIIKFGGTIVELLLPWMLSVILDEYAAVGDQPMIWIWGGLMTLCAVGALAGPSLCLLKWPNYPVNRKMPLQRHP